MAHQQAIKHIPNIWPAILIVLGFVLILTGQSVLQVFGGLTLLLSLALPFLSRVLSEQGEVARTSKRPIQEEQIDSITETSTEDTNQNQLQFIKRFPLRDSEDHPKDREPISADVLVQVNPVNVVRTMQGSYSGKNVEAHPYVLDAHRNSRIRTAKQVTQTNAKSTRRAKQTVKTNQPVHGIKVGPSRSVNKRPYYVTDPKRSKKTSTSEKHPS